MPMSCQSWEMASGPTVAYKMAGRTNGCVVVESPKGSNFSSFRVQDTMSRGFGESPKSSNCRISSSQDNVVRGFSALSLRGPSQQPEADSLSEENQSVSLGAFCCTSPELYRCAPSPSNESSPFAFSQSSECWKPLNSKTPACSANLLLSSEAGSQASILCMHQNGTSHFSHVDLHVSPQREPLNSEYHITATTGLHREHESVGGFSNTFRSSSSSLHTSTMGRCNDNHLEPDTMSESSFSSGQGLPLASSSSSGEVSHDDTEAESAYKEPTPSPPRKGLSKFYAGKSRSFSCLSDVVCVKDLAKPEIPHTKRRKANSSSSGLPPLQKGASTISKKPLHSGKSTLALAVAMNRKEEYEAQASTGPPRHQKSLVPLRSYSLSDLQEATASIFFIG